MTNKPCRLPALTTRMVPSDPMRDGRNRPITLNSILLLSNFRKGFSCAEQESDSDNDDVEEPLMASSSVLDKEPLNKSMGDDAIEVSLGPRGRSDLLQVLMGSAGCSLSPFLSLPFAWNVAQSTSHVYLTRLSTQVPIRVPLHMEGGSGGGGGSNRSPTSSVVDKTHRRILGQRLNTSSVVELKTQKRTLDMTQIMLLLERHTVVEEELALDIEMRKCKWEIEQLRKHIHVLKKHGKDGAPSEGGGGFLSTNTWDIHDLLLHSSFLGLRKNARTMDLPNLIPSVEQRKFLQRKRGGICHATFDSDEICQKFKTACNHSGSTVKIHKALKGPHSMIRVASSVNEIRHVALVVGPRGTSFFLSKDYGSSWYDQNIPPKLLQKISRTRANADIKYLAAGPQGSYFVELFTGECWWGIAGNDSEFTKVMNQWDVYRVAFGPLTTFNMGENQHRVETSWIVVGKDGRIAFRNIPSRLQSILLQRPPHMPSIAEVSLGAAGSYFVRFLDGSIDYTLPCWTADACKTVLGQGSTISSLSLHPDAPNDFILRHTRFHKNKT